MMNKPLTVVTKHVRVRASREDAELHSGWQAVVGMWHPARPSCSQGQI